MPRSKNIEVISCRLTELRIDHGYTQRYIADYLDINRSTYSYWETGTAEPSIDALIALADLYCVTLDNLLGRNFCADAVQDNGRIKGYVPLKEFAESSNASFSCAVKIAESGGIPNAIKINGYWHIPADAKVNLPKKVRAQNLEGYVTINDYAAFAGISRDAVSKRISSGKIHGVIKISGMYYIPESSIYGPARIKRTHVKNNKEG